MPVLKQYIRRGNYYCQLTVLTLEQVLHQQVKLVTLTDDHHRRHIIMGEHSFIELAGWLIGLFVGSPQLRCASLDDVMMWLSLRGWWYQLSIDCTGRTLWNE